MRKLSSIFASFALSFLETCARVDREQKRRSETRFGIYPRTRVSFTPDTPARVIGHVPTSMTELGSVPSPDNHMRLPSMTVFMVGQRDPAPRMQHAYGARLSIIRHNSCRACRGPPVLNKTECVTPRGLRVACEVCVPRRSGLEPVRASHPHNPTGILSTENVRTMRTPGRQ